MILDSQLQFSAAQALTVTAVSTNVIDTGAMFAGAVEADRNYGIGEPMGVLISVIVAADFTTTDETYRFDLQTDTVVGFGTVVTISQSTIVAALLTAGSQHVIPIPGDRRMSRFVRMNYTLGGTTPSVTVTAFLQPMSMIQNYISYVDALTIS